MSIEDLSKRYYQIGEVAEILGIPASTLRFWESKFPSLRPRRSRSGRRYYTSDDVDRIGQIHYLVKEKGLKLEAAIESMKTNPEGVETRYRVLSRLRAVRNELNNLLQALHRRR